MGILSIFALPLLFYDFFWPGVFGFLFDFFSGLIFLIASLLLFVTLKRGEASRIIPVVGGITPVFIFLFNYLFVEEKLNWLKLGACSFLILGSVIISLKIKKEKKKKIDFKNLCLAGLAGFFFAVFYVLSDYLYEKQSFISAFVWMRTGSFGGALFLLVLPKIRKSIFDNAKKVKAKGLGLLVANKTIAGFAFLLLNYALSLENSLIINSLQGVQYAFLFILTLFLTIKLPAVIKEENTFPFLITKITGIGLIILGIRGLFI